jgi:hypothetical protein
MRREMWILIVAPPSPLYDGVQALLAVLATVEGVHDESSLTAIRTARQGPPALIVCDETSLVAAGTPGEWAESPRIVLVERPLEEGGTAGCMQVVKGCRAATLLATARAQLLDSREST